MKAYTLVLALVGLVAAQNGLPQCAKDCVTKFTSGANIGGCPQIDAKCICSQQSFLSDIACCLADVCNAADQQAAVDYAVNLCNTQGVTVPSAVTCASAASTTTGAATASGSSTASGTSTGTTTTTGTTTGTTSAGTAAASTTATKNNGHASGTGSGAAGVFGGLLAALAFM